MLFLRALYNDKKDKKLSWKYICSLNFFFFTLLRKLFKVGASSTHRGSEFQAAAPLYLKLFFNDSVLGLGNVKFK